MNQYAETVLKIDLNALANNYKILSAKAKGAICASVVKANAYGLGVEQVATKLYEKGCRVFFVANLDEALHLRSFIKNINAKIYIFNGISDFNDIKIYKENNLRLIINTPNQIDWLLNNYQNHSDLNFAIHIDTGMNRLGLELEHAHKIFVENDHIKKLNPDFIMSHLACADDKNHELNDRQFKDFVNVTKGFKGKLSLSNSYGIFNDSKFHFDIVRPGCALYGVNPTVNEPNPMNNVISLSAKILQIRKLSSITSVGYAASAKLPKNSRVATIAAGYADGYLRYLGNKGYCYFKNYKLPIIGRVSMDLITLDLSAVPEGEINEHDEVELIGDNVTIDKIAEIADTIAYEILTNLGNRYKRIYI